MKKALKVIGKVFSMILVGIIMTIGFAILTVGSVLAVISGLILGLICFIDEDTSGAIVNKFKQLIDWLFDEESDE